MIALGSNRYGQTKLGAYILIVALSTSGCPSSTQNQEGYIPKAHASELVDGVCKSTNAQNSTSHYFGECGSFDRQYIANSEVDDLNLKFLSLSHASINETTLARLHVENGELIETVFLSSRLEDFAFSRIPGSRGQVRPHPSVEF